jgi:hypothetical protein
MTTASTVRVRSFERRESTRAPCRKWTTVLLAQADGSSRESLFGVETVR